MNSRSKILGAIRSTGGSANASPSQIALEAASLVAEPAAIQPSYGDMSLIERFVFKATSERVTATVTSVNSMAEIPAAAADYLERNRQSLRAAIQPTARLEGLDWQAFDRAESLVEDGGVAITLAEFGIAETGSVVVRSGSDAPVLMNFLPLYHIVVLRAENLLAHTEDLWRRFKAEDEAQPRLLTIITGTSGTADIEAKNVRGAHGPKNMLIVLVTN